MKERSDNNGTRGGGFQKILDKFGNMCYKEIATECRNGGLFMSIKIVADSSADLLELSGVDFAAVPLTYLKVTY